MRVGIEQCIIKEYSDIRHTEREGKSVGLDVTGEVVGDFVVGLLVGWCMI